MKVDFVKIEIQVCCEARFVCLVGNRSFKREAGTLVGFERRESKIM